MKKLSIDEYKKTVTGILVEIDQICREHKLTYMLMFGTLIGAIRHRGFIPWDDDIDIAMPRKDYERLMEILRTETYDIRFLSIEHNPDTIYPYGKICKKHTRVKEKNFRPVEGYGAFVDVFPLDSMPDDARERRKYCKKCRQYEIWITHSSRTGFEHSESLKTNVSRFLAFHLGKMLNTQKLIRKLNDTLVRFNEQHGETSYLGIPWGYYADKLYPSSMLKELTEVEFEGHSFYAPKEYDQVLKMRYGDYMKLPPEKDRVYLHAIECYLTDEAEA